jgi:Membrane protein implicated in regulation of membrane protease activity
MVVLLTEFISPEAVPLLLVTAGLLLSLAEALAPGANFVVVGIGLLGAGLVGLLFPFLGPFALGLFVLLFGIIAFYVYHEFDIYGGKGQAQTSDSDSLQGMTGRVTERVTPAGGEVKLQGGGFSPFYSARSMDGEISEGTDVMVIDPGGGNVVTVESWKLSRTTSTGSWRPGGRSPKTSRRPPRSPSNTPTAMRQPVTTQPPTPPMGPTAVSTTPSEMSSTSSSRRPKEGHEANPYSCLIPT